MKRRLLIALILLLSEGSLSAQGIMITVRDDSGKPFPYSFIFVNNKPVGVADSLGKAIIGPGKLSVGDSISASCIGIDRVGILYDETLKGKGSAEIVLNDTHVTLGEVTVSAADMESLFAKNTKDVFMTWGKTGTLSAKMEAKIYIPGNKPRYVAGLFTAENEIGGKILEGDYHRGYFRHPIVLTTDNDTTGLYETLRFNVRQSLGANSDAVGIFMSRYNRNQLRKNSVLHFSFLGEEDRVMKFRAYCSKENLHGIQTLLYIDKDTESLLHSDVMIILPEHYPEATMTCKTDHIYFRPKKNSQPMLMSENTEYLCEYKDGRRIEMSITDITYKVK